MSVTYVTRGTRTQILAGKGVERVELRWPPCPKLTAAELERADVLMREWDAKHPTESKEAA